MRPSLLLVFSQLMVGALLVTSDSFPESTSSVAMLRAARIVSEGASSSDYRSSADSSCGSGGGGSTTNGGGD